MIFEELCSMAGPEAVIDHDKKRIDLIVETSDGKKNRMIAYCPSESMQIIVWELHSKERPDISFPFSGKGRYLRINFCRNGKCEFLGKNGETLYLSEGEIAMDYKLDEDGSFFLSSDDYLGVEIIMQVDKVIVEIPTLAMLKVAIKRMSMPEYATSINTMYFVDASDDTNRTLAELIRYCYEGCDWEGIIIKTAELGHNIGTDLTTSKAKIRTFATGMQAKIAEDMHRCLTEKFGQKWPVSVFAKKYGLSETTLKNYFRSVYGYGYKEYQKKVRMEKAAEMLRDTRINIDRIAAEVGYLSASKFGIAFREYFGVSPSQYRVEQKLKLAEKSKSISG